MTHTSPDVESARRQLTATGLHHNMAVATRMDAERLLGDLRRYAEDVDMVADLIEQAWPPLQEPDYGVVLMAVDALVDHVNRGAVLTAEQRAALLDLLQ